MRPGGASGKLTFASLINSLQDNSVLIKGKENVWNDVCQFTTCSDHLILVRLSYKTSNPFFRGLRAGWAASERIVKE